MNLLDVVIVLLLLAAVLHGAWRGFWMSLAVYVGSAGGLLVGVLAAPAVNDWLDVSDPAVRQGLGVTIVLLGLAIGGVAGGLLGAPIRAALAGIPIIGAVDSALGAVLSVAITLVTVWLLGLGFARGPSPELAELVQQSWAVQRIDAVAPQPPSFLAKLEGLVSARLDPEVFAGLEPALLSPLTPEPGSIDAPGVAVAASRTVRVEGTGCGGKVFGSGFPVASDLIVTNAHVVAGTHDTKISGAEGMTLDAELVYFDPDLDLAILQVAGGDFAPLEFADADRGDQGATIGYPGGGNERIAAAVVNERREAIGRDIYNGDTVEREILVLSADVHPGNSGGPVVDTEGRVLGVVFATSSRHPDQAYALTGNAVEDDIAAAESGAPLDGRSGECAG